jgi:hypothetical protein
MDFETTFKIIASVAAAVAIPVAAYAAIAAIRANWVRLMPATTEALSRLEDDVEALMTRVGELEAAERRLLELEERVDFAERLLQQGAVRRPGHADTPPEASPAAQ